MRIGVRAHDFGKMPVEILAERIAERNFSCIQLALMKAIEGIDQVDGKLSPGLAYHIGREFHKRNIQIAVLGCYINPVHPDKKERKRQLDRFKEHIRYARDFGCSVIATETGSYNPDLSFGPRNHEEEAFWMLVESVGEMVEEAEKFGVFVGIEGVWEYVINSPSRMKRLIDAIPSNNLQVVLDPVNFISPYNYQHQNSIIKECFDLFADKIVAFHAKDYIIEHGRKTGVPIGKGLLDYTLIIRLLRLNKPQMNCIIEEGEPNTLDESVRFLKELYQSS